MLWMCSFSASTFASSAVICVCKQIFYRFCKSLLLFPLRLSSRELPHHARLPHRQDLLLGVSGSAQSIAENLTEAGLLRLVTSHRNDGSVLSSCCVKGIHRISQEDLIQNLPRPSHRRLSCRIRRNDCSCKLFGLNGELAFHLGQQV